MEDKEYLEKILQLEKKLAKAQKRGAVMYQKAKLLEEIVQMSRRFEEDARTREGDANALVRQLIARQRELSVMLNRSNTLVARMYEANKMIALEFQEAAKSLPAPQKAEIEEKIHKIDQLFQRTGVPDAQTSSISTSDASATSSTAHSFTIDEPEGRRGNLWSNAGKDTPPVVEAEPVEEDAEGEFTVRPGAVKTEPEPVESVIDAEEYQEEAAHPAAEITEERRRKWWSRFGFGQSEG